MSEPISPEEKARRVAYVKEWQARNRERSREIKRAWKERNRDASNAAERARYHSNIEASRKRSREHAKRSYHKHKSAKRLERNAGLNKWYHENKHRILDKKRAANRAWKKAHPESGAKQTALRRARIKKLAVGNGLWIAGFYEIAGRVSRCLGVAHEVDHIIPVARGGPHHESNLQVLPSIINRRKWAHLPAA